LAGKRARRGRSASGAYTRLTFEVSLVRTKKSGDESTLGGSGKNGESDRRKGENEKPRVLSVGIVGKKSKPRRETGMPISK